MLSKDNIDKNNTLKIDISKERFIFKDPVKVIDSEWVTSRFMISMSQLDNVEDLTIFGTAADKKITNTSLGMSLAVNAPYAFTRYTDPPVPGKSMNNRHFKVADLHNSSLGMGTYYSKAIDDNNATSLLFLTPGVVEFASLISVFARASDYKTNVIANEGRYPTMFDVGNIIGKVTMGLFFPIRSLIIYSVQKTASAIPLFTDHSYYHIKPTPAQYWLMTQNIVNALAAERGVLALKMKINTKQESIGAKYLYDEYRMSYLVRHFPLLFNKSGGVNVFSIATRAQKNISDLLLAEFKNVSELKTASRHQTYGDSLTAPDRSDDGISTMKNVVDKITLKESSTLEEFLEDSLSYTYNKEKQEEQGVPKTNDLQDENINDQSTHKDGLPPLPSEKNTSYLRDMFNSFVSTTSHGADGPVFHVDYVGATSDTFSNSIKDIPLKDKINTLGGAARDIRFSLAGGNLIGDTVNSVTNGVKDLIAGTASGLSFGISDLITGLLSGGYMRFGKMWQDSEAQLQSHTFKMRLGGPYNNKISQIIDQDLVISMLLSLVLPQSTGHGTYTSPLLCKAYMRGICNLDRAMITAVSIARGGGNLGYTQQGRSTNLEISVTVTDMSELLVAPLGDSLFNNFNQETALSRYIATLTGRDHRTNSFIVPKLKIALSNVKMDLETRFSAASLGVHLADTLVGDIISIPIPDSTLSRFNDAIK